MKRRQRQTPLPSLDPWLSAGDQPSPDPGPLEAIGFLDPPRAAQLLSRLGRSDIPSFRHNGTADLGAALKASPDPDLALAALERICETDGTTGRLNHTDRLAPMAVILGASRFLGDLLVRRPEWIDWLFDQGALETPADEGMASFPAPEREGRPAPEEQLEGLNSSKRAELLRIGARSVLGFSTLEEEFGALSKMADLIIQSLLESFWPTAVPVPSIVALGKLGGQELNFSSDVDLIFTFGLPEDAPLSTIMPLANRAVEDLVGHLTRYTAEGSLYRVDLRLRPGGDRAPLARTIRGTESYYAAQGAPWERQMLVKARPAAGDREAGAEFLRRLVPFIYPAHADSDPREEAHRHRRERRAREGQSLSTEHVKLAPGGIRDIEFIIQVLQLLYGGRRPELRQAGALPALSALYRYGVLPEREATDLEAAYRFLRRLEHLIQMDEDRQAFTLPTAAGRRRAFARLMGCSTESDLLRAYDAHRECVTTALSTLLPGRGEKESGEPVEAILNLAPGGKEAAGLLRRRGFLNPEQSHRVLIATGRTARAESANSWAAFVGLLPLLIEDAADTGAPDRALNNLDRILRRLGSSGAYARLMAREAPLRRALLALCASGELLTDLLIRHPEHFERLFSARAATLAADPEGWRRRLRQERRSSPDSGVLARRLEGLRSRETLATGLAYAVGDRSLEEAMSDLGALARDLVRVFLGSHLADHLHPPRVAVLCLGTMAAGAMSFASDADLLFVHVEGAGADIQTLASKAGGLLSPPGGPYHVDMRLRPEGRSAPISVDVDYLRSYLGERASAWEALAMARVRPLYGRRRLTDGTLTVIEEWLASFRLSEEARAQIREVRTTQEEDARADEGRAGQGGSFDVKRSPGAMADVEFIAFGLLLDTWQGGDPRPATVPVMLEHLVGSGRMDPSDATLLRDAYRRYRAVQVGLQLHYGRDVTRLPESWEEDSPAAPLASETAASLRAAAERVREVFERVYPSSL
jgi:glutamate-ammonia-ligase adenylyltransferase